MEEWNKQEVPCELTDENNLRIPGSVSWNERVH